MNWWKSIVSLAVAASTIFAPQLQNIVSTHPAIAAAVAAVWAVFSHLGPSPTGAALITSTGETGKATTVAPPH